MLWRQRSVERWPYRLWGRGKGVRSQHVGGGVCYSWVEILHFKHPARFGSKSHDHQDFQGKKTTTTTTTRRRKKIGLFFPLNLNVYINLDKLARARNNGDQFRWKKNIYSGCEKMRNASSCQGKNERQWKKKRVNRNTNISSIKRVTRKLKRRSTF